MTIKDAYEKVLKSHDILIADTSVENICEKSIGYLCFSPLWRQKIHSLNLNNLNDVDTFFWLQVANNLDVKK